ncbi:DUF1501 domain-containing protein [Nocardioides caldifontis]|uniref:DUF1501 domain-containing protein n=1 Tax=Nocardioides caldifontis TaxID=2588938 RepID=UPI0011DF97E6|nr:DUF1501 domain-containing protein [Nocardioides caldifontis]
MTDVMTTSPGSSAAGDCCEEFAKAARLSRRRFLGGVAAAGAVGVSTSVFGDAVRSASFAATRGGNVLLVISFRGGIDGMGVVVPHGDPVYATARKTIAVPKNQLVAADGYFGLHPKMAPLAPYFASGELAAVHAVGMTTPNRSHFEAMELIEDADPGSSLRQGWVNRMVGLSGNPTASDTVHLGTSTPPTLVEGPTPSVATESLADISLSAFDGKQWQARRVKHLQRSWAGVTGPAGAAAKSALTTVDTLAPLGKQPYTPADGVTYPDDWSAKGLAEALRDTAKLIKADIGTEVVSIDFGTWDFHDGYGKIDSGNMQRMIESFATSLAAFLADLGPLRSRVTIATISEFGRRTVENGNGGLDHGWGNMMLLAGAGIDGGKYHATWPGLTTGGDADLTVTTDYRQVLAELIHTRFPDKDVTKVFPGISYNPIGVTKPS